jgi:hypothetical protein
MRHRPILHPVQPGRQHHTPRRRATRIGPCRPTTTLNGRSGSRRGRTTRRRATSTRPTRGRIRTAPRASRRQLGAASVCSVVLFIYHLAHRQSLVVSVLANTCTSYHHAATLRLLEAVATDNGLLGEGVDAHGAAGVHREDGATWVRVVGGRHGHASQQGAGREVGDGALAGKHLRQEVHCQREPKPARRQARSDRCILAGLYVF